MLWSCSILVFTSSHPRPFPRAEARAEESLARGRASSARASSAKEKVLGETLQDSLASLSLNPGTMKTPRTLLDKTRKNLMPIQHIGMRKNTMRTTLMRSRTTQKKRPKATGQSTVRTSPMNGQRNGKLLTHWNPQSWNASHVFATLSVQIALKTQNVVPTSSRTEPLLSWQKVARKVAERKAVASIPFVLLI